MDPLWFPFYSNYIFRNKYYEQLHKKLLKYFIHHRNLIWTPKKSSGPLKNHVTLIQESCGPPRIMWTLQKSCWPSQKSCGPPKNHVDLQETRGPLQESCEPPRIMWTTQELWVPNNHGPLRIVDPPRIMWTHQKSCVPLRIIWTSPILIWTTFPKT